MERPSQDKGEKKNVLLPEGQEQKEREEFPSVDQDYDSFPSVLFTPGNHSPNASCLSKEDEMIEEMVYVYQNASHNKAKGCHGRTEDQMDRCCGRQRECYVGLRGHRSCYYNEFLLSTGGHLCVSRQKRSNTEA